MRLLQRKSQPEGLLDNLGDSLDHLGDALGGLTDRKKRSRLMKAGLIAGGLAALTAGSAAVSSLRRRMEASDS
jgi:hypothetical protein